MPHNETPRDFPQPPRRFDGPILDPLLVEEEFEETVGIVRRFAARNQDFTEERILAHLAVNGVTLYGTQEDWDGLFAEMRNKIVADAAERQTPAQITWITQHLGDVATYTMIEVSTPAAPAVSHVEVPCVSTEEAEETDDLSVSPTSFDAISEVLDKAPDGKMRPRELIIALARKLRIDTTEAEVLIDAGLFVNQLRKVPNGGTTYITVSNGESTQGRRRSASRPEEVGEERLLTEEELAMVIAVLDELATGHVSTGATIKNLEQRLNSGFSKEHFRKLVRLLDAQQIIRYDNNARYGQARKSPRIHFRDQEMKSRWLANRDDYIERLKEATTR